MVRNVMTRQEERTLLELLQSAGEATPEGLWRYHERQSEQTVLHALNARYSQRPVAFTVLHVARYREAVFGKLDKAAAAPPPWVEERLGELAQRLRKLEAWAAARPRTPFNGH